MKIKRNAPCHCGSGKKYKKCHYLIERQKEIDTWTNRKLKDEELSSVVEVAPGSYVSAKRLLEKAREQFLEDGDPNETIMTLRLGSLAILYVRDDYDGEPVPEDIVTFNGNLELGDQTFLEYLPTEFKKVLDNPNRRLNLKKTD